MHEGPRSGRTTRKAEDGDIERLDFTLMGLDQLFQLAPIDFEVGAAPEALCERELAHLTDD
ncbi:hypothetical protein [Xanthomonas oryzae]|uniref:hypothetical protein n=1 Tax=Xanthomonas oryzae TaxID=347 RepID=UPI00211712F1|nr:hypothetical protein [Xanthomonas oryzae]WDN38464.1 hypothetical protein LL926_06175 [Xanthomonas oryzae]